MSKTPAMERWQKESGITVDPTRAELMAEIKRLRAENADLKLSVIAFCALEAAHYGNAAGWPAGHLHPQHYDILANAGARMTDFTRHTEVCDE